MCSPWPQGAPNFYSFRFYPPFFFLLSAYFSLSTYFKGNLLYVFGCLRGLPLTSCKQSSENILGFTSRLLQWGLAQGSWCRQVTPSQAGPAPHFQASSPLLAYDGYELSRTGGPILQIRKLRPRDDMLNQLMAKV